MSLTNTGLDLSQLLVYSAATNTGMHAVQQAHLLYPSTYIIAVASAQHHSRLQTLGADVCFDYKSSTIKKDVKALGKNVTRAIDCHSEGPSTVSCARLMGDAGSEGPHGRIVRTLPPGMIQGSVPRTSLLLPLLSPLHFPSLIHLPFHTSSPPSLFAPSLFRPLFTHSFPQPFWFLFKYHPASPTIASKNLKQLTALLESGKVRTVRHRLVEGGLEKGLLKGFEEMKAGRVRGEKLVVCVDEEMR